MTPKVSVCIPTYNTARYLPTAIESVLRQDFSDFELVICDDASTDNTSEIVHSYDDSRIRYVRTAGKSGQSGIFNRCHQEARGELVTILHADDYFLPGFLSDRVRRFESSSTYDFVFGAVQTVDVGGSRVSVGGRWNEDRTFAKGELLEPMLHGCILCPPSLMIRRSCLEMVGPFNKDYTWGPDWEWDLRLAEHCGGCYTSTAFAAYRVHDASGTAEQLSAAKNGPQERRILRETFDRICAADPTRKKWKRPVYRGLSLRHMYFAQEALAAGRRKVTRSNLWYAALAHKPMALRPTFWALWLASVSPFRWYSVYRSARTRIGRALRPTSAA
jgi:glycosyltransferase involved in cell wall biosynthesis